MTEAIKLQPEKAHRIIIDSRDKIQVSGVLDVDSFDENEIIFVTSYGAVTVTGYDLHIAKLNLDEAMLIIEGKVQAVDYSDHEELRQNGGFFSRVFK